MFRVSANNEMETVVCAELYAGDQEMRRISRKDSIRLFESRRLGDVITHRPEHGCRLDQIGSVRLDDKDRVLEPADL